MFNSIISKFKRNRGKNSELYKHAKQELDLVLHTLKYSNDPEDFKIQKRLNESILKSVEAFCEFRHSGFSAEYSINNLIKLLRYEPLLPLTGENNEFIEVATEFKDNKKIIKKTYVNKRYSKLYREVIINNETGEVIEDAYIDIDYPNKKIKFPYYPNGL